MQGHFNVEATKQQLPVVLRTMDNILLTESVNKYCFWFCSQTRKTPVSEQRTI